METSKPILVTGVAGFIGFHLAQRLLSQGRTVVGIDNLNDYYDVNLKQARLDRIKDKKNFSFQKVDIIEEPSLKDIFSDHDFDLILHMAAQAGVRYSLSNPQSYIQSNLLGFANLLEACRSSKVKHLVYASSSSVYGANTKTPFSLQDKADHPVSLYGATKKANELMAYSYSHLYKIPSTGLRFFTVYGPWGRPDMALFLFAEAILEGKPIDVYNHGKMRRDFTFIDDVVESVVRISERIPTGNKTQTAPFALFNVGNSQPVALLEMIELLEEALGKSTQKNLVPLQPGDVPETYADVSELSEAIAFQPATSLKEGIAKFVDWYLPYREGKAS